MWLSEPNSYIYELNDWDFKPNNNFINSFWKIFRITTFLFSFFSKLFSFFLPPAIRLRHCPKEPYFTSLIMFIFLIHRLNIFVQRISRLSLGPSDRIENYRFVSTSYTEAVHSYQRGFFVDSFPVKWIHNCANYLGVNCPNHSNLGLQVNMKFKQVYVFNNWMSVNWMDQVDLTMFFS